MFPLPEYTIDILIVLVIGACMTLARAVLGPISSLRPAIILFIGLVWPWPIAIMNGLNHYTLTEAFFFSGWTVAALIVGLVLGAIAHRAAKPLLVGALVLFPWFAGTAFVFEQQRVPDLACAKQVDFRIASLTLTAPRSLGLQSVIGDGSPEQAWAGAYAEWVGAKPDVRALCRASDGGRVPVEVAHIWLPLDWFEEGFETSCSVNADRIPPDAYCDAMKRTSPSVIQLYARPDGEPRPSYGYFDTNSIIEARSDGEREGYRCTKLGTENSNRACTIWFNLTPEILAVSTARVGPRQHGEDPLADTVYLVDAMIRRLSLE